LADAHYDKIKFNIYPNNMIKILKVRKIIIKEIFIYIYDNMKTKKERIFYYDFLRAFAIIAVIICHVDIFFGPLITPPEIIFKTTFHDIGRIGVPIFLMISGALLLNREYELPSFIKKRFTRIIYPFIFWMILTIIGLKFANYNNEYIWNMFIGNPSITWYFWTLIGIYLAIPIFNSFIREYGEKGMEYFLIIWFITILLQTFNHYPPIPSLKFNVFAEYIGYPILGYYLTSKQFKMNDKKVCIIGSIILIISLMTYVYIDYNCINLIESIYLNIPIVFMGSGMFLFIKYLDKLNKFDSMKNNVLGKIITSISIYSYGIYFSHVFALKIFSMINPHSNLYFIPIFLGIIFISWLLPFIVSKIPYLKIFSGA